MGETFYLILRISLYTFLIVLMVFSSKKIISYLQTRNPDFKLTKRVKIIEKLYIYRDSYLVLIGFDDEEILCLVTGNNIKILSKEKVGEEQIEK